MKFMSTLRDEQLDQYSHWNKLHVAGHWTSQINCKKQNWNFLSLFFFSKLWTPNYCRCQAYLWPAAMVFCPLSRGLAHNHQYAIPHQGLLLDNPDLDLCKAALSALPGTPTVSPAKQYHLQKQHVLIRASSTFCEEVFYPWGYPDQKTDVIQRWTGRRGINTFPYKAWENQVSQAHPKQHTG